MAPRQIAALAVRVLALYCIIQSFDYLQVVVRAAVSILFSSGSSLSSPFAPVVPNRLTMFWPFLPFAIHAAFGVFLWMFAEALAVYMVPRDDIKSACQADPPQILTVGTILLGIWFVASAAPTIIGLSVGYIFRDQGLGAVYWQDKTLGQAASSLVQVGIGSWLVFGTRGLIQVLHSTHPMLWLRDIGRDPIPAEESRAD